MGDIISHTILSESCLSVILAFYLFSPLSTDLGLTFRLAAWRESRKLWGRVRSPEYPVSREMSVVADSRFLRLLLTLLVVGDLVLRLSDISSVVFNFT